MRAIILFLLLLILSGCAKTDTVVSENILHSGGEYWELLTIEGKPAGFQRTALAFEEIDGQPVKRFERQSRLIVLRNTNVFDVAMKVDSISTTDGGFESCSVQLNGGGEPMTTNYRIDSNNLLVDGKPGQTDWKAGTQGPEAVLCELLRSPMQPGEIRQVSFFEPAMQSCVETTLQAEKIEPVDLGNVTRKLLRINVQNQMKLPQIGNQTVTETFWTDACGNIIRHETLMDDKQTLRADRVSKSKALALIDTKPSVELGNLGVVPLNRSIPLPHGTDKLEFVVESQDVSLLSRFPNNAPFQMVEPLNAEPNQRAIKITVYSAKNDRPLFFVASGAANLPTPEDLESSPLIRLDDPQLQELAAKVDLSIIPWETAVALEKLVHETIQQTTFSTAFVSSSEILKSKSGDCTEFAVLLTALCRAKKIPARIVLGLVYTPLKPKADSNQAEAGMAFHLWNEVYVDGVWRPLDATLALGGADAARIKIADDSLMGNSLAPLCNSVLGIVGRIKIRF